MIAGIDGGAGKSDQSVKILLLGPPEIYLDNRPVLIKRRLNRALLFYLAALRYPVSREELCDLFWPEEDEETARKNLREALSRIRTGVGVDHLIIADGEQVSLNPSVVWVDYLELTHLITPLLSSSEMTGSSALPEWMVMQLKRGMALCRTNRFLQGVSIRDSVGFDNWLDLNNQSYTFTLLKVCDRLVDHYISNGNLEEALIWLGKATEIVPLDEHFNYLTLICLRDTGKNQELLDYSNYLERLYLQQQETYPERFREISEDALRARGFLDYSDRDWPDEERGEPVFINRVEELGLLNRLLHARGTVLVKGEAGIGKTRLIKHFYLQQPFHPRLLYCRSHPLGTRVAFYSIMQPLHNQIKDEEWRELDPADQERLSAFYHHALQGLEPPTLPIPEDGWLPVLEDIFYAFMKLMEILAARRPLLFVLDDAMYADQASISLISFLVENGFFDKHGLLVISISPEVENRLLGQLLQRIRRARKLDSIDLPPFSVEEVKEFISVSLGRIPSDQNVEEIHHLTGGNPYYLTECVRTIKWTVSGDTISADLEGCDPPETISSLVNDKLSGLEAESAEIIQAAAILGEKFCSDVLEEMMDLDSERISTAMEELIREGFIEPNYEIRPLGGFKFKHDIERRIILDQTNPAKKLALHAKAASALEIRRKGFPRFAAALADHYEVSLQHPEAVKAWLEAGRYARSQYLKEETYRVYGKALDLILKAPDLFGEKVVYELVNEFGNYAYERDDMETCAKVYRGCLQFGQATQDRTMIGTAYNGLGRVAFFLNHFDEAKQFLSQANWFLENTAEKVEQTKQLVLLGSIHYSLDEYIECRECMEKALAITQNETTPYMIEAKIEIISVLCAVLCYMGEPVKALRHAEEMVNISLLSTTRSAPLKANAILAMCEFFNDHFDRTIEIHTAMMPLAEKLQLRFWYSLLDTTAAMSYLEIGNLDQAWYLADRAHKRESRFADEKLSMYTTKALADFYRIVGDIDKAIEYYMEIINSGARNYPTAVSKYFIGLSLAETGRKRESQKWFEESIEDARQKGFAGLELNAELYQVLFLDHVKSGDQVEKKGRGLLAKMQERGIPEAVYYESTLRAAVAEIKNDKENALAIYEQLIRHFQATRRGWLENIINIHILGLMGADSPAGKAANARTVNVLESLAAHATYPSVRRAYLNIIRKTKKRVNELSTKRVYKYDHK